MIALDAQFVGRDLLRVEGVDVNSSAAVQQCPADQLQAARLLAVGDRAVGHPAAVELVLEADAARDGFEVRGGLARGGGVPKGSTYLRGAGAVTRRSQKSSPQRGHVGIIEGEGASGSEGPPGRGPMPGHAGVVVAAGS